MKTKTKKPSKGTKLFDWYEGLDLYSWWEQFSLSYADNGQHKYVTVLSFIKAKTSDPKKKELLWWVLGPKAEEPRNPELKSLPQFDWQQKRSEGFWNSNNKIETIKQAAASRMSSIDEVKATGAFNLDDMGRIKMLADQLDSEFGGRLQLPNLSAKENDLRLNNYLRLRSTLQSMLHQAQEMFAKTRSMDFNAIAEMMTVVGPAMLGQLASTTGQLDPDTQRKLNSYDQAVHMMMNKSGDWNIPLPDKEMSDLVKKKSSPTIIDRKKVQ